MTATGTAGNRWPQDGRLNRLVMWLGHYQEYFLLAVVAVGVTQDLLASKSLALAAASVAAWIAWAAALFGARLHAQQLCERCVSDASVLDPEGAVKRWRPALWCYHRDRLTLVLMLAVLGWSIWATTLIRHEQPWQHVADAFTLAAIGYVWATWRVHRRLEPWCPWCRWDDGGEEEVSPAVPDVPAVR